MCECKICNKEQKSLMNLSKHLSNKHKYSPREYYDLHLKKDNENICVICGNETKYIQFTKGYNNTCSHKCGAILYRKELRADVEKFANFKNKVKKNQIRIWEEREEIVNKDGISEKEIISNKAGATISSNNLLLTKAELNSKYGWLNKLSTAEKEKWKTEIMLKTGSHLFWKNATKEQRKDQQAKRCETMIKNGKMIDPLFKSEKERYYIDVWKYTRINYALFKRVINPLDLKTTQNADGYTLDHIFSIQQGFLQNIPAEIIGSAHNLRMLTRSENSIKYTRCDIDLITLMEKYNGE